VRPAASTSVAAQDSLDWRTSNVVNDIKDQGHCGSCRAFYTIQALEFQWAIVNKKLSSLSESNLVDCATSCYGCDGGWPESTVDWVIANETGQLMLEFDYPYKPPDDSCKFDQSKAATKTTGYVEVTEGSEADLLSKVAANSVASVCIDPSHQSFQLYTTGIYNEPQCRPTSSTTPSPSRSSGTPVARPGVIRATSG
jgi:cathepsin L